jgi:hypothetical protein
MHRLKSTLWCVLIISAICAAPILANNDENIAFDEFFKRSSYTLPSVGSIRATYEMKTNVRQASMCGYDIASGAWYIVINDKIIGRDANGGGYEIDSAGKSRLSPDRSHLDSDDAIERLFPFAMTKALQRHRDRYVDGVLHADGSMTVTFRFPAGVRSLIGSSSDVLEDLDVTYTFSPTGHITGWQHEDDKHLVQLLNVDGPVTVPAQSFGYQDAWRLSAWEFDSKGRPEWFSPVALKALARSVDTKLRRSSTPAASDPARGVDNGVLDPLAASRSFSFGWTLIGGGCVVLAVGVIAWWRNRA